MECEGLQPNKIGQSRDGSFGVENHGSVGGAARVHKKKFASACRAGKQPKEPGCAFACIGHGL
jgi:hypothetical protein